MTTTDTRTSHTTKSGLSTLANMVAIRCVAAVTGLTIVCPCVLADGKYTLTDIGNLFDGSTYPFAVNNDGQIVGMSFGDGFFAAPFLWEGGAIQELPTFGGQVSESGAGDITEDGVIVGWAATTEFHPPPFDAFEIHRAFILDRGRQTQLDGLIPHGDSVARGINTNGWVVGWGHSMLGIGAIQIQALLWVNEELTNLGTLGGANSEAWDINGLNQIVGESGTGEGQTHAFLWQDGVMIDIDTFGTNQSVARAINDASQITGIWRNAENIIRGFVWQDGIMTDLGTLGGMYAEPFGINDKGEIVGSSSTQTALHGFIWRDGKMFDLNEMVDGGLPNNFVPRAISHNGQIVGSAFVDGNAHAFLLTPTCLAGLDCTVGPDDFSAFRGFYNSGDLDSLLESDDDKLCYNPGIVLNPTEAPITLDFTATLPTDSPSTLDVTIESSANTVGLELTISFWNFNTDMWDVVGTDTQSLNADTVRTFAGIPADHVEPGTGEVRTRYEVRVVSFIFIFPWLDCVDHVFWTISG